jgi:hypothetical protein
VVRDVRYDEAGGPIRPGAKPTHGAPVCVPSDRPGKPGSASAKPGSPRISTSPGKVSNLPTGRCGHPSRMSTAPGWLMPPSLPTQRVDLAVATPHLSVRTLGVAGRAALGSGGGRVGLGHPHRAGASRASSAAACRGAVRADPPRADPGGSLPGLPPGQLARAVAPAPVSLWCGARSGASCWDT